MTYASFWKRLAAYLIDGFLFGILLFIPIVLIVLGSMMGHPSQTGNPLSSWIPTLYGLAIFLVYFVWAESSSWQGTLGKKLVGIKVADSTGKRLSFWHSLARNLAKVILAHVIFYIGYLFCLWTQKKQCLHDMIARCVVIDPQPDSKKKAAIVIGIVGVCGLVIFFFAGIFLALAIPQYSLRAELSRTNMALSILSSIHQAENQYRAETGHYTGRWDRLVAEGTCESPSPNICEIRGIPFSFKLAKEGIIATRENHKNYKYQLVLPLDKQLSRENITCTPLNNSGRSQLICNRWTGKLR